MRDSSNLYAQSNFNGALALERPPFAEIASVV
jgi:hypothetical protein